MKTTLKTKPAKFQANLGSSKFPIRLGIDDQHFAFGRQPAQQIVVEPAGQPHVVVSKRDLRPELKDSDSRLRRKKREEVAE